ncbi:hypothetical protein KBD59_00790 [Candidatus Gracilibacteria bacterium]|nr:hypothetical protein [Candidatus Gracilibacteria bacterium]
MKIYKSPLLLPLLSLLLLFQACGSPVIPVATPIQPAGYYIENDYLWLNDQKISEETVGTLLGSRAMAEEHRVFTTITEQKETRIYFTELAGCEGCILLSKYALIVNNETGKILVAAFQYTGESYLFHKKGVIDSNTLLSPDGTKAAFVREENILTPETIWMFDFTSDEEKKVATLEKKTSVLTCDTEGMGLCTIDKKKMNWNNDELTISLPHKIATESEKYDRSYSYEYRLRTEEITSKENAVVHPFDFDEDGQDEFVVYFEKPLTKKTPIFEYTENGAYEIYKWEEGINPGWKIIFQDEGTVGKNYGVTSIMKDPRFYREIDLDKDGTKEVEISTYQDGSGGYVDSYILKWENGTLIKAKIKDSKTEPQLRELFLKENEDFGPGDMNYMSICPLNDYYKENCRFKQGAPGALGQLNKSFTYAEGVFTVTKYDREDSPINVK